MARASFSRLELNPADPKTEILKQSTRPHIEPTRIAIETCLLHLLACSSYVAKPTANPSL